jgi:hypothetical protein
LKLSEDIEPAGKIGVAESPAFTFKVPLPVRESAAVEEVDPAKKRLAISRAARIEAKTREEVKLLDCVTELVSIEAPAKIMDNI